MKVKDAVLQAAKHLGIYDSVEGYLERGVGSGKAAAERLIDCFNTVENELAFDYLPLYMEDEMQSRTGQIYFSELSESAVRILGVEDEWGNSIPFRLFPAYLKTQPGKVRVKYTYTPKKKDVDGESDFTLNVSERLISYGMAAEYCVDMGMFTEAAVWDKKYKDGIVAACSGQKGKRLRSRRWV